MKTSVTTEGRLPPRFRRVLSPAIQGTPHASERQHSLAIWITLIAIAFPQVPIRLGDINVTPGRFAVLLLLLPALGTLLQSGRTRFASDFFAVAFAFWMLGSSYLNGGFTPYVGAEAVEFLGAYLAGRAFVYGPSNLRTFIIALKRVTVIVIALALLDSLTSQNLVLEFFGMSYGAEVRFGIVRAASVFEGAEHFGSFCVSAAAIFFYSERGSSQRLYLFLTFLGCVLALSSGPFLGLIIITAIFAYDTIMKQYPWRWKALTSVILVFILMVFVFYDHPVNWLIVHFTLDPQTGFFRLGTWNAALPVIDQAPFIGHGMGKTQSQDPYLTSVDCIWLVEGIRYGLVGIILLILTMFLPCVGKRGRSTLDQHIKNLPTGFSLAVISFGIIGLTVHFWDATWLFMSLCIGIRASLAEYELKSKYN